MVEIRKLQPSIHIRMPARSTKRTPSKAVLVVRRREDFPPPTPQPTPCVLWQGSVDPAGYGRLKVQRAERRRTVHIHRHVMELFLGRRLKPNEIILHACDNPPCYRIDHLSVGTVQDNNADMFEKGRAKPPPKTRTMREKRLIAEAFRDGLSVSEVARVFGCERDTVRRYVALFPDIEFGTGPPKPFDGFRRPKPKGGC